MTATSLSGKTVYISGPCKGYDELNKPLFDKAEQDLPEAALKAGFAGNEDEFSITIVHPHQEGVYSNLTAAVQLADALVLLPGFARMGGTLEDLILFCQQKKPVFFFDPNAGVLVQMSPAAAE